ncbi:hypothetical protein BZM26_29005 [Paraburkholderia strydomiana]|nr:hypothetical protein BZM26_29005 [Paraburkholderia strydomiana]
MNRCSPLDGKFIKLPHERRVLRAFFCEQKLKLHNVVMLALFDCSKAGFLCRTYVCALRFTGRMSKCSRNFVNYVVGRQRFAFPSATLDDFLCNFLSLVAPECMISGTLRTT